MFPSMPELPEAPFRGLSAPLAFAMGAVLTLLLAIALASLRRAFRKQALRSRFEHAAHGEARARDYLVDLGYEILGAQVAAEYILTIDDRELPVRLRADYVVQRDGKTFVAEVKTGTVATQIETTATRRQLLEYRAAFDVDGILLVDADLRRVSTVVFPVTSTQQKSSWLPSFALCLGALVVAAAIWLGR